MQLTHIHKRIDKLFIGMAHLPCFGQVDMLPVNAWLWHHNQMQKTNFIVLFTT
jgi:hypothetical protein